MPSRTPYVSGCYIVKDEEEMLPASLAALAPFVDEIVVYDTGSTDRTREIAAAHGARVVEGFWDDDFGGARNRALRHCSGTWVVAVDADEVVVGDPGAWRRGLRASRADMLLVEVVSTMWDGAGEESRTLLSRVMRRSRCRWEGPLHEQVVARHGRLETAHTPHLVLEHHGYNAVLVSARNKGERNLTIAESALRRALEAGTSTPAELATLHVNLGRSANAAEDHARALAAFADVDQDAVPVPTGVVGAHAALDSALRTGDVQTARCWLDALARWVEGAQVLALFEGRLAIGLGELERAEALLRSVRDGRDFRGLPVDGSAARDHLVECLLRMDRPAEALDVLLPHVASGRSSIRAGVAVELAGALPGGLARLAETLPAALVRPYLGQLAAAPAPVSAAFFAAMWAADRERTTVMLAASTQWATLGFPDALTWSFRLREAGLADQCPLRRVFTCPTQDTATRVLSGAALLEIGDEDVVPGLEALLLTVDDEQAPSLLDRLRQVSPGLVAQLVPA